MVHPVKTLLHPQSVAVRTARVIDPASWIQPDRLDHESVVVHPFSDGVPVPPRLRVLGELSPIRPDDAPVTIILIQVNHLVRSLNELEGPQFIKFHAREPDRVTQVHWIV